jgi:hypothetical protein
MALQLFKKLSGIKFHEDLSYMQQQTVTSAPCKDVNMLNPLNPELNPIC